MKKKGFLISHRPEFCSLSKSVGLF